MAKLTQTERDDLMLLAAIKGCWLNGIPAFIKGRLNKYATVYQHDSLLDVQYSWQTIKRVMNKDRCFVS